MIADVLFCRRAVRLWHRSRIRGWAKATTAVLGATGTLAVLLTVRPAEISHHRSPAEREAGAEAGTDELAARVSAPGLNPVQALWTEFLAVRETGPAGKGQMDDLLCELRGLLTTAHAADVVRSLPPEALATIFGTVALEAWIAEDSLSAGTWLAEQLGATENHAWLLARVLANQPEALGRFCERLGTTPWADAFLDYASREVLRTNPAAAVSLAESLPPGERRLRLFETIAFDWMEHAPDAASAWINGVREPVLRQRLVTVASESYASVDPLSAVEWLLVQSPGDYLPQQSIHKIVEIWRQSASVEARGRLGVFANTDLLLPTSLPHYGSPLRPGEHHRLHE
jgi:hypothetical protein